MNASDGHESCPTTPSATSVRHPVRVGTDGDFHLPDILALPGTQPARRPRDDMTLSASLNSLGISTPRLAMAEQDSGSDQPEARQADSAEAALLHRMETAGFFQPPVRERVSTLTPEAGAAWLALAARWIDLAVSRDDLRFLNAACKLLGAVWLHHHDLDPSDSTRHDRELTAQLAAVGRLLNTTTRRLRQELTHRVVGSQHRPLGSHVPRASTSTASRLPRIAILASAGSLGAKQLVAAATSSGVPITVLCWFNPPPRMPTGPSNYADAWYPPATPDDQPPAAPAGIPTITTTTWSETESALDESRLDLILLAGMPIVPAPVLETARLGVLNAHNGALPGYRGMDAVGWALLNDDPVVCTLHLARRAVDAGEVLGSHVVPSNPLHTLRRRVKATQVQLLVAGATYVTATGHLPEATPQPDAGRQFYRLHPELKRLLDSSPYAARPNQPAGERGARSVNSGSPHPSLTTLERVDWDDTSSILDGCTPLFDAVTEDPALLVALVNNVTRHPHLAEMCEGYDFLYKLVLYDAPQIGVRVRLHLYRPGFFDRPHNHRWSFASHILHGAYTHRIFGSDTQFGDDTDPATLKPIHERVEDAGATYALHHSSVHTVQAQADTMSLLVRGPAAKRRFLILDATADSSFWVYGAADESPEQRASKRLSADALTAIVDRAVRIISEFRGAKRRPTGEVTT